MMLEKILKEYYHQDCDSTENVTKAIRKHYKGLVPEEQETPHQNNPMYEERVCGYNQCRAEMLERLSTIG